MKPFLHAISTLSIIVFLTFGGCAENVEESIPPAITEISIDTLEVFASFEEQNIAPPSKITLLNSGEAAISAISDMTVSVVSSSGELKFKSGREGRGPGEFSNIHYIYNTGQTLTVVDSRESRASRFSRNGEFLNSYLLDTRGISTETTILEDSIYVAGGEDGYLLKLVDLKQDSILHFGEPRISQPESIDIQQSLSQFKSGEVPDFFKNMFTVRSDGEYIYVYFNSYSDLRKYTRSGDLVWEKHIELPYNQIIYDQLMEIAKNRTNVIPTVIYITDFRVVEDSIYFLSYLPSREHPQLLVRVNQDGYIDAIYTLPTTHGYASGFDIDPRTGTMYFASSDHVTTTMDPLSD